MESTEKQIQATCPECRGPLSEIRHDDLVEYRCLVGHTYSDFSLLLAHHDAEEEALWAAVVALEEAAKLVDATKSRFAPENASRLEAQARAKVAQAGEIRHVLERLEPFSIE